MRLIARLLEPDIDRHLLHSEDERVIDEVRKHWVVTLPWMGLMAMSIPCFLMMIVARQFFWLPLMLGLYCFAQGMWKVHVAHMDRFIITNMRVFRVHGVFNTHMGTMPMARILDISLEQPLLGKLLNYGHLIFESAAQAQGLRDIRYVGRPAERDLTIQRVIQRSGLRKKMEVLDEDMADGI